ncbi:MAG: hypothetical protein ACPGD5_02800 [Salibacteraceae bacterium]
MKETVTIILILLICFNVNSQDNIFKNNVNEIASTSYDNRQEKATNTKKQSLNRKGVHSGIHGIVGKGGFLHDGYESQIGIITGIDLNLYFNDYVGLKTGVEYLMLTSKYETEHFNQNQNRDIVKTTSVLLHSVGLPLKFLLTTGDKIGLYLETGLCFHFPIKTEVATSYTSRGEVHEDFVVSTESTIGLNVKVSPRLSLNFGPTIHYSLQNYLTRDSTKGFLLGFNVGMVYKKVAKS